MFKPPSLVELPNFTSSLIETLPKAKCLTLLMLTSHSQKQKPSKNADAGEELSLHEDGNSHAPVKGAQRKLAQMQPWRPGMNRRTKRLSSVFKTSNRVGHDPIASNILNIQVIVDFQDSEHPRRYFSILMGWSGHPLVMTACQSVSFGSFFMTSMSSPSRDGAPFSTSPISVRGESPVLRRRTSGDTMDLNRPRLSPTLARSFDPHDPQVLERQRTMDVDMAMQLSMARRETVSSGSPGSSYENRADLEEEDAMFALSPQEQHAMIMARGDETDREHAEDSFMAPETQTSVVDLREHMQSAQDPSLLVSEMATPDDPVTSNYGLPTYQANASHSTYDFSTMEAFAREEKATLGLPSSPVTHFTLPPRRNNPAPEPVASTSTTDLPTSDSNEATPRPMRQRKLSSSNAAPRRSRKGIGAKLALFEGSNGAPPASLPPQFGNSPAIASSSTDVLPAPTFGGILNNGHDRPYRFSFYSNALTSTIHARSLSELPAEGQTFESLFAGLSSDDIKQPRDRPPVRKPSVDPGRSRLTGGMIGSGVSDGPTWWLDVLNPTDEEMKMLSKVFSIHPLTTEDIQMEEAREKIELFRNYYLVCFRSFDQDAYSPTYLEPLNMYIIVFREGTLSVSLLFTPMLERPAI